MVKRRLLTKDRIEFTKEGQSFVGDYVGMETVPYQGRELNRYTFTNEKGTFILIGSMKIDEGMAGAAVGEVIEITWLGIAQTSNGNAMKLFKIEVLTQGDEDAKGS